MDTEEFVATVTDICPELDPAAATDVCVVAIRTLCEYLPAPQVARLQSRLPDGLRHAASIAKSGDKPAQESASIDDFCEQLMARTEIGYRTARQLTSAIATALADRLEPRERQEIAAGLPGQLGSLLDADH